MYIHVAITQDKTSCIIKLLAKNHQSNQSFKEIRIEGLNDAFTNRSTNPLNVHLQCTHALQFFVCLCMQLLLAFSVDCPTYKSLREADTKTQAYMDLEEENKVQVSSQGLLSNCLYDRYYSLGALGMVVQDKEQGFIQRGGALGSSPPSKSSPPPPDFDVIIALEQALGKWQLGDIHSGH